MEVLVSVTDRYSGRVEGLFLWIEQQPVEIKAVLGKHLKSEKLWKVKGSEDITEVLFENGSPCPEFMEVKTGDRFILTTGKRKATKLRSYPSSSNNTSSELHPFLNDWNC